MIKRISLIAFVSVMAITFAVSCSKADKYADIKTVINETIAIFDNFSAAADKVKDEKELIAAIEKFNADITKIAPKYKELEKKYPEMKDDKKVPADLKELNDKMMASINKLTASMSSPNVMKLMKSPNVAKAIQKMGELTEKTLR